MVDLLSTDCREGATESYPVYHVDNPVGQPWKQLVSILAEALEIPAHGIVSFEEWIRRVRSSALGPKENPAAMALGFLQDHFERMACGGIVLDTVRSSEHSETMAAEGPVSAEVVKAYVRSWKEMGFLHWFPITGRSMDGRRYVLGSNTDALELVFDEIQ